MKKKIVTKVVNFKTSDRISKKLHDRAEKYAQGNLSAWLRFAGLHYTPPKGTKVLGVPGYVPDYR